MSGNGIVLGRGSGVILVVVRGRWRDVGSGMWQGYCGRRWYLGCGVGVVGWTGGMILGPGLGCGGRSGRWCPGSRSRVMVGEDLGCRWQWRPLEEMGGAVQGFW